MNSLEDRKVISVTSSGHHGYGPLDIHVNWSDGTTDTTEGNIMKLTELREQHELIHEGSAKALEAKLSYETPIYVPLENSTRINLYPRASWHTRGPWII